MPPIALARLAPLTGVGFVVLVIAAFIVGGEPPDVDETTEEVVRWWSENDSKNLVAALLGGLSAAFLVWFSGSLRSTLRRAEGEPGRVAAIAFGGFLIAAVGWTMFAGFGFAAADTVGDVPAEATHTLAVLSDLFWIPFGVGILVAFLATAVCVLRHGGLPRWLGYVAILIAIVLVTPAGFGAFVAAGLWILVVSVLLFLREEPGPLGKPGT